MEDKTETINNLRALEQKLLKDVEAVRETIKMLLEAGGPITTQPISNINKYRKARKDAGLTMNQLAEKAGVTSSIIRSLERGYRVRSENLDKVNNAIKELSE